MRKLLVAVCVIAGSSFVADMASARVRIGRIASSKPAPMKVAPRPETAKAAERPTTPRTWIVATPRPASTAPVAASAAPADMSAHEPAGPFAAASSVPPAADHATPTPTPNEKSVTSPVKPATAQDTQVRMAGLERPTPKLVRAGSVQPHKFVVCYWNRTGQCVP